MPAVIWTAAAPDVQAHDPSSGPAAAENGTSIIPHTTAKCCQAPSPGVGPVAAEGSDSLAFHSLAGREGACSKPTSAGKQSAAENGCSAQDELLDAIHWMRTVFALAAGLTWGLIPLQGLEAILAYVPVLPFQ